MGAAIDPSVLLKIADSNMPAIKQDSTKRLDTSPVSTPSPAAAQPEGSLKRERYTPDLHDRSEEAKRARLLARQERNRQSAQCSREKKKLYVVQLEEQVKQLWQDKSVMAAREAEALRQREALEKQVSELSDKVQSLQDLVNSLLGTASAHGDAQLCETTVGKATSVSPQTMSTAASAAPVAAPAAALDECGLDTLLSDSTRLPAVEATRHGNGAARQWVLRNSSRWTSQHSGAAARQMQRPTAAALMRPGLAEILALLSTASASKGSWAKPVCQTLPGTGHQMAGRRLRFRLAVPRSRTPALPAT